MGIIIEKNVKKLKSVIIKPSKTKKKKENNETSNINHNQNKTVVTPKTVIRIPMQK